KTVGPNLLLLDVKMRTEDAAPGRLTTYVCSVSDQGPGSPGLIGALTRKLGAPPTERREATAIWVYVGGPRGRFRLPASGPAATEHLKMGDTLVTIGATEGRPLSVVTYYETLLEPPPA